MPAQIWIYEGEVEGPKNAIYGVGLCVELADEEPKFEFKLTMVPRQGQNEVKQFVNLSQELRIENPLIEGGVVVSAASAYGVCVGGRFLKFSILNARKNYTESHEEIKDLSLWERAKDICDRIGGSGDAYKKEIETSLVGCTGVNWLLGKSDDEDDQSDDND